VRRICDRLGYISGNNFGWTFDVRAEPRPTDLAYTAIELLAHTDQPYRQPVPGIQLLHCLRNEAPGGDSTLVDGLAAAEALAAHDPEAHAALVDTDVEYRYDMLTDTVVGRGPLLEYDRSGRFQQIRLNTKIDAPLPRAEYDLDGFYRGRRWLTEWLNDPAHQVTFRLEPGDAMFMDNLRVLHGRTAFDASKGVRHLQGAYIDHDGPDTMYRLAVRSLRSEGSST
jgi:gamma-butyrobetaine dioxygenase